MLNNYFNMKKGVMLFVVVVFFASFVNAGLEGDCAILPLFSGCSAGEFVDNFYFSHIDNAHVCFNDALSCYNYGLCCPGSEMSILANIPLSTFASISSYDNAHIADEGEYDIPLRFVGADDQCFIESGGCTGEDVCLFSMYSLTNSHAGPCGSYNYEVCCAPSTPDCPNGQLEIVVLDPDPVGDVSEGETKLYVVTVHVNGNPVYGITVAAYDLFDGTPFDSGDTNAEGRATLSNVMYGVGSHTIYFSAAGEDYCQDSIQDTFFVSGESPDCQLGEQQNCQEQDGVCAGSYETCNAQGEWPGCTSSDYGDDYEIVEVTCDDSLDNDCDTLVDGDDPTNCEVSSDCVLSGAHWEENGDDDIVSEGKEVTLTVSGNEFCSGEVVFDIAETDCAVGFDCDYDDIDQEDTDELNVKQISATFSGVSAVASWTSEWVHDDNNGFGDDDPEYYFKATLSDARADSDQLKVEIAICGDGIVNQDWEECDELDLGEEEDCESYKGDDWEGPLGCYDEEDEESGDGIACYYDDILCGDDSGPSDDPDNTFRQWGECVDDGDGDNIGTREVYLYNSETGIQICTWGVPPTSCVYAIEECFLGEEEIPFFSYLAFMVFLFIVSIFYGSEMFKKKSVINKNNKEVESCKS